MNDQRESKTDSPDMKDITSCVICGKTLKPDRVHVDTCGGRCYQALLKIQRGKA